MFSVLPYPLSVPLALLTPSQYALLPALLGVQSMSSPTLCEATKLVAPHPDSLELVHSWFAHHGMKSSSILTIHGGSWLTVTRVPVTQANELHGASYELYRRTGTNDTTILYTIGYAHPVALHIHVQTVVSTTCLTSMSTLLQALRKRSEGGIADMASKPPVTPEYALDRGLRGRVPEPGRFEKTFMLKRHTDANDATFNVVRINGGEYDSSKPNEEPNQYALAMAYPTALNFYCRRREEMETWEQTTEPIVLLNSEYYQHELLRNITHVVFISDRIQYGW
ncbi:hypothetical protein EDB87DRAFT_1830662 [Lactarius vividus]|nr:hypothetical protein EDB87DRAFT_1830662 [Lactarius vividus]